MSVTRYRYRYELLLPSYVPRIGNKVTGTFTSHKKMSAAEVETMAKEMSHGQFNSAELGDYTETVL